MDEVAPRSRLRSRLRRARRFGRRALDLFPLTPLGLATLLGAGAALRYLAYPSLDLVWLVVGYGALGLAALALLAVSVGTLRMAWALRASRAGEPLQARFETQRSLPTGFVLPTLLWLPFVQVELSWRSPEDAEATISRRGLRFEERVALASRGHIDGIVRRVVIGDAFGLCRLALWPRREAALTARPHVGKLGTLPMLVSLAGGEERPHPMGIDDGDRVELRRYVPGDPARFIHWKVFGRTRKLVVRVPERALSPARRTVAYLVAGAGDEASAAAARVAIESESLGVEWSFGADGSAGETSSVEEAIERIVRSIEARGEGGRGLEAFLRRAETRGPAGIILFVPPEEGPWVRHVLAALEGRAPRVRVVIGTDGLVPEARPRLWRRLLFAARPRAGTPAERLESVVHQLARTRAKVVILDRASGRQLGGPHLAAASARHEAAA